MATTSLADLYTKLSTAAYESGGTLAPETAVFAEKMLLGGVLNGTATVADLGTLPEEAFTLEKHRRIYRGMLDLEAKGAGISCHSLATHLMEQGYLPEVGGVSYVLELGQDIPGRFDVDHFVDLLEQGHRSREFLVTVMRSVQCVVNGGSYEDARDSILAACASTPTRSNDQAQMASPDDIVGSDFERFFGKQPPGIPTGIGKLDMDTYGLHEGELIIIGARPGDGKTALLTQICATAACAGYRTEIISLEMSQDQLLKRIECQGSGVSYHAVRSGALTEAERAALIKTHYQLTQVPLFIDDGVNWTLSSIKHHLRTMHSKGTPVQLLGIDYLQLMDCPKGDSRHLELGAVTRGLKLLAKEFRCVIILLSQLNRNGENQSRKPIKADLRDSGSIEADADVILLLWHDRSKDSSNPAYREAEILLEKQRNGPTGPISVWFDRNSACFSDR